MIVQNAGSSDTQLKAYKLLLVEDNPGDARLLREILSEAAGPAFALDCADSLSAALEHLNQGPVDLILLDLTLPDSIWYETFHKLHEKAPRTPIVILTGMKQEAFALDVIRKGAQDYLIKGQIEPEGLVRTLLHAIERHKTRDEMYTLFSQMETHLKDTEKLIDFSRL